jgi:hypothetical protein
LEEIYMAALLVNKGEETLVNWIRSVMQGAPVGKDVFVKLFSNNETPVPASVAGDFDEATFKGYVTGGIQLNTWTAAFFEAPGYLTTNDEVIFAYDSGEAGAATEDIYGATIVDEDGNLIAAELFVGGPFTMANDGDEIAYTAKIKLAEKTEACA